MSLGDVNDFVIAIDDDGYWIGVTPPNLKRVWITKDNEQLVAQVDIVGVASSWFVVNLKNNSPKECVKGPLSKNQVIDSMPNFDQQSDTIWEYSK